MLYFRHNFPLIDTEKYTEIKLITPDLRKNVLHSSKRADASKNGNSGSGLNTVMRRLVIQQKDLYLNTNSVNFKYNWGKGKFGLSRWTQVIQYICVSTLIGCV